ncbi:TonB-dependent receptor [Puniceicoccaceae bacterium K14]|nr:TonB-dependent receptor [Puniceicoccaceae bacterium K14]
MINKNRLLSKSLLRGICIRSTVFSVLTLSGFINQSSAQDDDDVFVLSPFEVTDTVTGYTATQTTTGVRIAADIKDMPFTVDVAPVEFFDDFSLYDETEQLALVPGISPAESKGDYQLRGIAGSNFLRNGFLRFGITDKTNIERIEVIKGPAAAIYGKTLPGGIVNVISKKAKNTPEYNFEFTLGQEDLYRAQGNFTGPIIKDKLLYRFDVSTYHELAYEDFRENEHENYSGQLTWLMSPSTNLTLEVDRAVNYRGARDGIPWARYQSTGFYDGAPAWEFENYDRSFNASGPNTFSDLDNTQVDIILNHQINDTWSMRASANAYDWNLWTMRGRGEWDPETNEIWNRRPEVSPEFRDGRAMNIDLLGDFNQGEVKHKLLVTLDYTYDKRHTGSTDRLDPDLYNAETGYPGTQLIDVLDVTNPDYTLPPLEDFNTSRRNLRTTNKILGLMVSDRITLMDGKLLVSLGGRYDTVDQIGEDFHNENFTDTTVDDLTVQSGVNYNLNDDVTLYFNYSTSFFPQRTLAEDGSALPNQEGVGFDFGAKFELFNDKIFVVANYFELEYKNIAVETLLTLDDGTETTVFRLDGLTESSGFELNAGGEIAEGLDFKIGAAYVDAEVVESSSEHLIGLTPRRVPNYTFGGALKYRFQEGALEGSWTGLNVTYQSGNRITDSATGGRYLYTTDEFTRFDWSFGYTLKPLSDNSDHSLTLTVKNLFDEEYLYGGDPTPAIGRQFILRYNLNFR